MDNQELLHWGIKGMKWGQRRFQNKDGSLTPAGKKRYSDNGSDGDEGSEKSKPSKPRKKSVSEMTDDELVKAINRARMEDAYRALRPETVSKGNTFASTVLNDVVKPAAVNAGKRFLEKGLNKITDNAFKDVADPDSIAGLEKMAKKLELKNKISKLKKGVDDKTIDEQLKEEQLKKAKRDNAEADAKAAAAKADKEKKTADDSNATSSSKSSGDAKSSSNTSEKKSDDSGDSKVYTGTVFGEGTSKGSQSRKNGEKWWKDSDFQDVDYTEVKDSSYTKSGKDYADDFMDDYNLVLISGLLEEPKK